MNKTHTPDFGTIPAHIKLWRAGKIADAYLEQENALVLAQVERDRLKAQVEELRGALQTLLDFNIASGNDRTSAGGVGPFAYAGTEYSPITQAKAALAKVSQ